MDAVSDTLLKLRELVAAGEVRVSEHGYNELAADGIAARDAVAGLPSGTVVEDYPEYPKGPCVLILEWDRNGMPIHVVWGIPKGAQGPAVLVTAYRPDPGRWSRDFLQRRT